jgi:hypothetical protein
VIRGGVVTGRSWGVALALAAILAATACKDDVTTPSSAGVPLGHEFTLAVSQSATVEGAGLRVTLRAVRNDSRCPVDVQCVWEGDATVAVELSGASAPAAPYDLHTSGRFPREATHAGYQITLVRLDPAPRGGTAPASSDYRATLVVVR